MSEEKRPTAVEDATKDAETKGGSDGATNTMIVGGVDLRELQAAYAQHPTLARWHNTTLALIGDLQDTKDNLLGALRSLQKEVAEKDARITELEARAEEATSDEGSDAPAPVEG